MAKTVVLASASPRRRQLMERLSLPFVIDVAEVGEEIPEDEHNPAQMLAERKARAVARRHPESVVIGADTLVFCKGRRLGKPADEDEAAQMLAFLSGTWHEVVTGLCCIDTHSGRTLCRSDYTRVRMVPLTEAEIRAYIATGEPMDKAGAYGMQGRGGVYVDRIEGSPTNVIGLPMSLLRDTLRELEIQIP